MFDKREFNKILGTIDILEKFIGRDSEFPFTFVSLISRKDF